MPRAGLRSSSKTDDADLSEETHRLDWGRFAAQREQAHSLQIWVALFGKYGEFKREQIQPKSGKSHVAFVCRWLDRSLQM